MRILVISTYYKPDGGPAPPLYSILCEGLARRGHDVTVITTVPHYPSGRVPVQYRGEGLQRKEESEVDVIRVPLPSLNRAKLPYRLFQFLVFQIVSVLAGFNLKYDVLLTHTPALEVFLPFVYFSTLRRKPAVYSVHDVYPDVGVNLGIFRNKAVIWIVTQMEQFCLCHAKKVRILSDSFTPTMHTRGVTDEKLSLIYDWVDTETIKPLPRDNDFAIEYDLVDKFVVLYAGNIGFVQGLESIIDTAILMDGCSDILFAFVGDGAAHESIIKMVEQHNLTNVRFISYQPLERMSEVFATADISLVTLRKGTGFGALPSKTYSILSSGKPIIASVDQNSDTWNLVKRSWSGLCIQPESPLELKEAIHTLKQNGDLRKEFGINGRKYVLKNHSSEYATEAFEALLIEVIKKRKNHSGFQKNVK